MERIQLEKYDLEIQRQDKGADLIRAGYQNLHSGQEFKKMPDTYTIFIMEKKI